MARRRYLIAGNWKMNISSSDVDDLLNGIIDKTRNVPSVTILVCPPFTSIPKAQSLSSSSSNIFLGAQNLYPEKNGAYTGEISAVMLRELGVSYVIVGHSERRSIFNESDQFINKKVKYALSNNLIPILCVGETIFQRKAKEELLVIEDQIEKGLENLSPEEVGKVVIAYEPVWAIGTGETATPEIAQNMHAFIRKLVNKFFGNKIGDAIKILYGGSLNADNAKQLLSEEDVDGGLIGGASLKTLDFCKIINIAAELSE